MVWLVSPDSEGEREQDLNGALEVGRLENLDRRNGMAGKDKMEESERT